MNQTFIAPSARVVGPGSCGVAWVVGRKVSVAGDKGYYRAGGIGRSRVKIRHKDHCKNPGTGEKNDPQVREAAGRALLDGG